MLAERALEKTGDAKAIDPGAVATAENEMQLAGRNGTTACLAPNEEPDYYATYLRLQNAVLQTSTMEPSALLTYAKSADAYARNIVVRYGSPAPVASAAYDTILRYAASIHDFMLSLD